MPTGKISSTAFWLKPSFSTVPTLRRGISETRIARHRQTRGWSASADHDEHGGSQSAGKLTITKALNNLTKHSNPGRTTQCSCCMCDKSTVHNLQFAVFSDLVFTKQKRRISEGSATRDED